MLNIIILSILVVIIFSLTRTIISIRKDNEDLRGFIEDVSADNFATIMEELNATRQQMDDYYFHHSLFYYDFLNYLHKTCHLFEDSDGKFYPTKYNWSIDEELRFINFKKQINEECARRGLPERPMSRLEGL